MLTQIKNFLQKDPNIRNLLKHSRVLYAAGIITTGLILLQQLATAKIIGAAAYGRFAAVIGSSALILLLIDVRTWELANKLLSRSTAEKNHSETKSIITWLFIIDIFIGITGCCLFLLVAPLIATHLLKNTDLLKLVKIYALCLPFKAIELGVMQTVPRFFRQYKLLAGKSILNAIMRLLLVAGAALYGFKLTGVIIAMMISEIFSACMLFILSYYVLQKELQCKNIFYRRKPSSFEQGKRMLWQLWLSGTLKGVHQQLFIPLLAAVSTPLHVGIFRCAQDISSIIPKLTTPARIILFPEIIRIHTEQSLDNFKAYLRNLTKLISLFIIPVVLGIILIGPLLLPRFFPDFKNLSILTGMLALAFGIDSILIWIRSTLVSLDKLAVQNKVNLATGIASVSLLIILGQSYGAIGAGSILLGHYIISRSILLIAINNHLKNT